MKKTIAALLAAVLLVLTGCSRIPAEKGGTNLSYTQITQEEAKLSSVRMVSQLARFSPRK